MEELEARDALLRHLLSIQEPRETLGLSLKLAMGLGNARFGALYTPDKDGYRLRAACGWLVKEQCVPVEALAGLALEAPVAENSQVLLKADDVRDGFGIQTLGVLPVRKDGDVVALVEMSRGTDDPPMQMGDLKRIDGFLPYIALAVDNCLLQEKLSGSDGDVDELLKSTERWNV